jgi:hypothetical protein
LKPAENLLDMVQRVTRLEIDGFSPNQIVSCETATFETAAFETADYAANSYQSPSDRPLIKAEF